jgi:hypothetical protein
MMLGLSVSTFTTVHTIISFIAIATGFVVVFGMLAGRRLDGWTFWFLLFTALTNITGFMFPFEHVLPSHFLGILSLAVMLLAIVARYAFGMNGAWRGLYVAGAVAALWTNMFALVAQSFGKISALHALAPTQSEPPFLIAELVMLAVLVAFGVAAARKFHPQAA